MIKWQVLSARYPDLGRIYQLWENKIMTSHIWRNQWRHVTWSVDIGAYRATQSGRTYWFCFQVASWVICRKSAHTYELLLELCCLSYPEVVETSEEWNQWSIVELDLPVNNYLELTTQTYLPFSIQRYQSLDLLVFVQAEGNFGDSKVHRISISRIWFHETGGRQKIVSRVCKSINRGTELTLLTNYIRADLGLISFWISNVISTGSVEWHFSHH